MSDDPLYIAFRTYLRGEISMELAALTQRGSPFSVAEREQLSEVVFAGKLKRWQRAADSVARTAAQQALGLSWTADTIVEEVLGWKMAAAIRKFAEVTAKLLLIEAKSAETRSVPVGSEQVRELVKQEVASHLKDMHRGVWSGSRTYERGQMATYNGGTWSCQRDGATAKPGDSGDWLLIVKAGRDGRDRR